MKTPQPKTATKQPEKLRMVPPGEPPAGYRWCKRGEPRVGVYILYPDGRIEDWGYEPEVKVGHNKNDLGDDGSRIHMPFIRPLAHPKRAKKRTTIMRLAHAAAMKSIESESQSESMEFRDIFLPTFRTGFLAGYRAARRRAGGAS